MECTTLAKTDAWPGPKYHTIPKLNRNAEFGLIMTWARPSAMIEWQPEALHRQRPAEHVRNVTIPLLRCIVLTHLRGTKLVVGICMVWCGVVLLAVKDCVQTVPGSCESSPQPWRKVSSAAARIPAARLHRTLLTLPERPTNCTGWGSSLVWGAQGPLLFSFIVLLVLRPRGCTYPPPCTFEFFTWRVAA